MTIRQSVCIAIASLWVSTSVFAVDIIFISENNSAGSAVESIVAMEYNQTQKDILKDTDLTAFENYENLTFLEIPESERSARYNELLSLLGLNEDDPQDKGFTDVLTAAGYDVYRSLTVRETDPITGVVTAEHEFHPGNNDPDNPRLTSEQLELLNSAKLIILSKDIVSRNYERGKTAGTSDYSVRDQWLGITTPMIIMHATLNESHEWDPSGWGLSYGYFAQLDAILGYDRMTTDPRFVDWDRRPKIVENDAIILAGLTPVEDDRLNLFNQEDFPILPRTNRKFSNNMNYGYPSSSKVILEFDVPSFVHPSAGEIFTRDPVMIEYEANIPGFSPEAGIPSLEKVGTPASKRLYFAAGIGDTGLYNLSGDGETVFLNAVEQYAGASSNETWYSWPVPSGDPFNINTGSWMGWVHIERDPWIYSWALGKYVYMTDDSGWVYAPK